MGRSRMNCMKITLHLLALCLLLSVTTKVSGKPNPRHLLIETKEQKKAKSYYQNDYQNFNSQVMTNSNIFGGKVSQTQNNNGGGSHNSNTMKNSNIHGGLVSQTQNNGWGSHNSQNMDNSNIHGGAGVSQTQNNGWVPPPALPEPHQCRLG